MVKVDKDNKETIYHEKILYVESLTSLNRQIWDFRINQMFNEEHNTVWCLYYALTDDIRPDIEEDVSKLYKEYLEKTNRLRAKIKHPDTLLHMKYVYEDRISMLKSKFNLLAHNLCLKALNNHGLILAKKTYSISVEKDQEKRWVDDFRGGEKNG